MSCDLAELPPFLTVDEAAAVLRIGRTAAYEAVKRGEIPAVAFGRRLRVPRAGLLRLAGEQSMSRPVEHATSQHGHEGEG